MFMMAFSIVQNCLICRNTAINFLYAYRISCMSIILSSHNILTLCWRHADSTNTVQCCVVDVAADAVDNRIYQYCRRHPNHFIQAFSVALVLTDSRTWLEFRRVLFRSTKNYCSISTNKAIFVQLKMPSWTSWSDFSFWMQRATSWNKIHYEECASWESNSKICWGSSITESILCS